MAFDARNLYFFQLLFTKPQLSENIINVMKINFVSQIPNINPLSKCDTDFMIISLVKSGCNPNINLTSKKYLKHLTKNFFTEEEYKVLSSQLKTIITKLEEKEGIMKKFADSKKEK